MDRHIDGQTYRQTDGQTDIQTGSCILFVVLQHAGSSEPRSAFLFCVSCHDTSASYEVNSLQHVQAAAGVH